MLVESPDGRSALLGRSRAMRAGMLTCLSGFVDQVGGWLRGHGRVGQRVPLLPLLPHTPLPWPTGSPLRAATLPAWHAGVRPALCPGHAYPASLPPLCRPQGESIEEAVRRETREEAGVALAAVDILGSQPWPVGASAWPCEGSQLLSHLRTGVLAAGDILGSQPWPVGARPEWVRSLAPPLSGRGLVGLRCEAGRRTCLGACLPTSPRTSPPLTPRSPHRPLHIRQAAAAPASS